MLFSNLPNNRKLNFMERYYTKFNPLDEYKPNDDYIVIIDKNKFIPREKEINDFKRIDYSPITNLIYSENVSEKELKYLKKVKEKYPVVFDNASKVIIDLEDTMPEIAESYKLLKSISNSMINNPLTNIIKSNTKEIIYIAEIYEDYNKSTMKKVISKFNDIHHSYAKNTNGAIADIISHKAYTGLLYLPKTYHAQVDYNNIPMVFGLLRLLCDFPVESLYTKYKEMFGVLSHVTAKYSENDKETLQSLNESGILEEIDTFLKLFVEDVNNVITIQNSKELLDNSIIDNSKAIKQNIEIKTLTDFLKIQNKTISEYNKVNQKEVTDILAIINKDKN